MSYGMEGHLGISVQQSFGTATSSYEYFPIISEGLSTDIEVVAEEGMRGLFAEPPIREGLETGAGDMSVELRPENIGHFLRGVTGSVVTSTSGASSGTIFTHEFIPVNTDFDEKTALPPYTFEVYRGTQEAFEFTDVIMPTLGIEIAPSALVKGTVGLMSRTTSLMTKNTPAFQTDQPFIWDQASLSLGGSAFEISENVTISFDNQVEGITLLNGTKRNAKFKRTNYQLIRLSGSVDLENLDEFDVFKAQTERPFVLTLEDTSVASGTMNLEISIPIFRYRTFPIAMGGPGRISVGFESTGIYDTTSSYGIRFLLTNSRGHGY